MAETLGAGWGSFTATVWPVEPGILSLLQAVKWDLSSKQWTDSCQCFQPQQREQKTTTQIHLQQNGVIHSYIYTSGPNAGSVAVKTNLNPLTRCYTITHSVSFPSSVLIFSLYASPLFANKWPLLMLFLFNGTVISWSWLEWDTVRSLFL